MALTHAARAGRLVPQGLSDQRVLVTGAAGFIGRAVCGAFAAAGADVHGTSRKYREPINGVRWWRVDLAEPEPTAQLMNSIRPDLVIHLASHVSGNRALAAVNATTRDNLLTTVNLLTAACETGAPRTILAGSMEESDGFGAGAIPGSPYAAAKTAASAYARMFHRLYGLPIVQLRVFMVYGPGQQDETKLVPYVATSLLRGQQPDLSSGARKVDWIYVDDVVEAVRSATYADNAVGEVIDIGSGELSTVRAVVERISRLVGSDVRPHFGALEDRPLERVRVADVSRSAKLLGWQPTTPLDEGLKRTVQWYRDRLSMEEP